MPWSSQPSVGEASQSILSPVWFSLNATREIKHLKHYLNGVKLYFNGQVYSISLTEPNQCMRISFFLYQGWVGERTLKRQNSFTGKDQTQHS